MLKDSMQKKVRERFYCTPKAGLDFSGVLLHSDRRGGYFVFADVVVHPPDAQPQNAKGELYVEKSNIAYAQLMPHVDN